MKNQSGIIGLLCAPALASTLFLSSAAACAGVVSPPYKVGIVCTKGAASDKITAVFRAVDSMGFVVKGITADFIMSSNFKPADFDVIILPGGTDENRTEYELSTYSDGVTIGMGNYSITSKLHDFVANGGGIIGLERGAQYIIDRLTLTTNASYTATANRSLQTMTYYDANFGSGTQAAFKSAGGGYLTAGYGQTSVAKDSGYRTVVARNTYGAGRIVMSAYNLELRSDSLADWTQWDNWLVGNSHPNSVGSWQLLGKLINWAAKGTAGSVTVNAPEPTGTRVAIVSSWYYTSSVPGYENYGGASPALLPAVARAVQYAGYVPIAIRWDEINTVPSKLDTSNFKAVVFPGGFSYGYKSKIGYSTTSGGGKNVSDFIAAGGGALGICAGSFYLSSICHWVGTNYPYLGIYEGTDSGPITLPDFNQLGQNMEPISGMTLASVHINDSTLYPSGNNFDMHQVYYGGGYKTGGTFTSSVTYNTGFDSYDSGNPSVAGYDDAIRFTYGSYSGHVYLIGTHPEVRADGSLADWLLWSNYDTNGRVLSNPDNPWTFIDKVFDNWVAL